MAFGFAAAFTHNGGAGGIPDPSAPVNYGLPTLDGPLVVGQQLVFSPGSWGGYPTPVFTYQLKRGGVNIAGTSPYTLLGLDYGTTLTLEVVATNSEGVSAPVASTAYGPVAGFVPANTVLPAVTGSTALGSVLTASNGTYSAYPTSLTYTRQWTRDGSPISGATAATYTIALADSGTNLACVITPSNAQGAGAAVTSTSVTVQTFTVPTNTVAPVVTGSNSLGDVLTSTTGTFTGNPSTGFTYSRQWARDGFDIPGATAGTYTIVVADSAASIVCKVRATNAVGQGPEAPSNAIVVQTFAAPSISGVPTISGTPEVGNILTSTPATASGNPAPVRTHMWTRDNAPISGAAGATYSQVPADVGTLLRKVQIETNALGSASATSAPVGPITGAPTTTYLMTMDDQAVSMDDLDISMEP